MNTNGSTDRDVRSIPGPLTTAADMPSHWNDVELGFDAAAERIIQAHKKDGAAQDLPIGDIKTWVVAPKEGEFALVPLTRHHEPKPLRSTAFSHLMSRIGAPADFLRRLPAPLQLATTNYLMGVHEDTSSATLRLRGEEVAAVVSGMVDDVQRQVEQMRELTVPERKAFETELAHEAETLALPEHVPLFNFVNALTSTARKAAPARRLELEALAGDVLGRHVGRGS